MNIRKMYREYCLVCKFKKRKVLSEWFFRHIFNTQFNLTFHPLVVDSCKTCDSLHFALKSNYSEKTDVLIEKKRNHLATAEIVHNELKECIRFCRDFDKKTVVLTFDLQRALEMPSIETSIAYYKRQLWLYNLCIYDEIKKQGFMYVWDETIASRGAQEIASCLHRHFLTYVPPDTTEIILYSDACGGQNRNIKMSLMLKKFIVDAKLPALERIEQRFFVSGHSYNKCDGCSGLIEKQRKNTQSIYVPEHWFNVIRQSKKSEPKYTVVQMSKEHFFSSKSETGSKFTSPI